MHRLRCNVGEYGVIVNKRGELLILKLPLSKKFNKEAWMFPGGRMNSNDKPGLGLQRETFEETGLKIKVVAPIHTAMWGNENPLKYSVFYLCRLVGKQNVKISSEHADSKWISFSDIKKIPWHNENSRIATEKAKSILGKPY